MLSISGHIYGFRPRRRPLWFINGAEMKRKCRKIVEFDLATVKYIFKYCEGLLQITNDISPSCTYVSQWWQWPPYWRGGGGRTFLRFEEKGGLLKKTKSKLMMVGESSHLVKDKKWQWESFNYLEIFLQMKPKKYKIIWRNLFLRNSYKQLNIWRLLFQRDLIRLPIAQLFSNVMLRFSIFLQNTFGTIFYSIRPFKQKIILVRSRKKVSLKATKWFLFHTSAAGNTPVRNHPAITKTGIITMHTPILSCKGVYCVTARDLPFKNGTTLTQCVLLLQHLAFVIGTFWFRFGRECVYVCVTLKVFTEKNL